MRIPSRPYRLTPLLHVESRDIDARTWQAHVLKHPFGLGALYNASIRGERRWDAERWDSTDPPTISPMERADLAGRIAALEVDGRRCAATRLTHEVFRGRAPAQREPCYECPSPLVARCADVTHPVGDRYAAAVDRILHAFADSVEVPRREVPARVVTGARRGDLRGSSVLSVGRLADGKRGARINDGSGVRVELYLEGGTLRWRTTYRRSCTSPIDGASFLLDVLPAIRGAPLSDRVLVPRRWWERTS